MESDSRPAGVLAYRRPSTLDFLEELLRAGCVGNEGCESAGPVERGIEA
jgi:hypothetical protein